MKTVKKFSLPGLTYLFACAVGNAAAQTPGAPTIGTAAAGDTQAFVFFTAPAAAGSTPIIAYTASCSAGSGAPTTGSSATAPIAVAGLVNATSYACTVTANNGGGAGPPSAAVNVTPMASAPLTLIGVASRKTHGLAGVFDIPINSTVPIDGAVNVEPRVIGAGHNLVFQFNALINSVGPISAIDEAMVAVTATPTPSGNEVSVSLPTVTNNKRVTVSLPTVNGTAVNASASIGLLLGDVNDTRSVNSSDISSVKARSGQSTTATNFRFDVNASGAINSSDISSAKARSGMSLTGTGGPTAGTIMFVAQVPTPGDFTARLSTFGNHKAGATEVIRGGDLMIRYADGTLRNLTREAGFGVDGLQADTNPPSTGNNRPIAVREPSVHWSGTKAVFSMVVGGARQFLRPPLFWQIYEVAGLGAGQSVVITKVPNQPAIYNNVSPIYGTDDRVIFTSDRPRDGQAHLYPQLDEYETAPIVTGIFSIDAGVAGGDLKLLTHTPSGAFTPHIDSFGRVVFTRWDHMQQDQQADVDRANPGMPTYGSFNFTDESPNSTFDFNNRTEIYPEPRAASTSGLFPGYPVNGYTSNLFTPWQINEDGTDEETLNHIGRHELTFGFIPRSFTNDANLSDNTIQAFRANRHEVGQDTGLFHLREDPANLGTYLAIHAREFGSLTANQIVKLTGSPSLNAEGMVISDVTARDGTAGVGQPTSPGGRYRNPLPLVSGSLIASHTTAVEPNIATYTPFRLKQLTLNPTSGLYSADPAPLTGAGVSKAVSWFTPDALDSYNGLLWEIEPVEVVARTRPPRATAPLPTPESTVFSDVGVDPVAFRTWLTNNNLALIVTRNQTVRDRADLQQPFNLRVPGGVSTIKPGAQLLPNGANAYDISHYQIFQADLIRGFNSGPSGSGRRVIAQNLHDPVAVAKNSAYSPNPGGPVGSVKIASDGSTAAFVPARRAMAWQTTDDSGNAVVRERVWVTMQPGEIRVCASCHGVNAQSQSGAAGGPINPPLALRTLLQAWKAVPTP